MKRLLALIALAAFCGGTLAPLAPAAEPKTPAQKRALQKKAVKKKALRKAQKAKNKSPHKPALVEPRRP